MLVTLGITVGFGKSDNLTSAYGIAVSATMLMTSVLLFIAMREVWGWSLVTAGAIPDVFMLVHAGSSKRDLSPGVYQGLDFPMRNSVSSRASPPPWRGAWEKVAPAA
jgi:KUP system potassium uptake protein